MNKSGILLTSINKFYETQDNGTNLLNVLKKKSGISLRNLEWFITTYAKKNDISYTTEDGKLFIVHCAYKSSLDGYSKSFLIPFVGHRSLPIRFREQMRKFIRHWHS